LKGPNAGGKTRVRLAEAGNGDLTPLNLDEDPKNAGARGSYLKKTLLAGRGTKEDGSLPKKSKVCPFARQGS